MMDGSAIHWDKEPGKGPGVGGRVESLVCADKFVTVIDERGPSFIIITATS